MSSHALSAIQAMKQGCWHDAEALWQSYVQQGAPLNASDYNAWARVNERLGDWTEHARIVSQGITNFPHDPALQRRDLLCRGLVSMDQQEWDNAWALLTQAQQNPVDCDWPCAVSYHRWNIRLQKRLAGINDRKRQLCILEELSLYKASVLALQRISGIELTVEAMPWPRDIKNEFLEKLRPVSQALGSYDIPLDFVEDAELRDSVAELALVWRRYHHFTELPCGYYEFFARVFAFYGHLKLYIRLRNIFKAKVSELVHRNEELTFIYQVALANEQGDFSHFSRLAEQAQKTIWTPSQRENIERVLALSTPYYRDQRYIATHGDQDVDFLNYIKGKRVAIVGPVDVGLENGEEIDGFDIIVRFNHRAHINYDAKKFGSRTDISWYTGTMLMRGPTPEILEGMSALSYALTVNDTWKKCGWQERIPCRTRDLYLYWPSVANPFLVGYPNGMQRAAHDILRFQPAQLKLFAADLYTSKRYQQEYALDQNLCFRDISLEIKDRPVTPFFSVHDPISNFRFLQSLYEAGHCDADEVLSEVLALSADEYMARVEQNFVGGIDDDF